MKKLLLLFGLLIFVVLGCSDDYSVGVSSPIVTHDTIFIVTGKVCNLDTPTLQMGVCKGKKQQHVMLSDSTTVYFSDNITVNVGITVLKNKQHVTATGLLSGEPFKGLLKASSIVIKDGAE